MGGGSGLQLRVIDRGRARVVQVGERRADRPIRVGIGEDCDVRVGSGALVHCELFVHRGRWVVRDASGGAGGTWLNDRLVSKGAYLKAEDRVVLGDSGDAAVIEVGPVVGAAVANAARPAAPDEIPELMVAGGADGGDESWHQEDEDEHVAFSVAASGEVVGSRASGARGRRGGRGKSGGGMGWTVLLTALVVVAGGAAVWKLGPVRPAPAPQPVAKGEEPVVIASTPVTLPVRETKSIFDNGWQKASGEVGREVGREVGGGRKSAQPAAAAADPRKQEEAWLAIEKAMAGPAPGRAIYLIEEYRAARPGVLDGELKKLAEAALDRIWWERVRQLCERRDELRAEIQQIGTELSEETDAEFRKKLEADRAGKEETVRGVVATLRGEMGYVHDEVPNPVDDEMLVELRRHREVKRYEAWGAGVVQSAKSSRGNLPWEKVR